MSIIDRFRAFVENAKPVPKDGLYYQALQVVSQRDWNGDKVVNLRDPAEAPRLGASIIERADAAGNANGLTSIGEVRSFMQRYDTGGLRQPGANGVLGPFERMRMWFSTGMYQAGNGAGSV